MIWFLWLAVGVASMYFTRNDPTSYKIARFLTWFYVLASFAIAVLNFAQTGSITQ